MLKVKQWSTSFGQNSFQNFKSFEIENSSCKHNQKIEAGNVLARIRRNQYFDDVDAQDPENAYVFIFVLDSDISILNRRNGFVKIRSKLEFVTNSYESVF